MKPALALLMMILLAIPAVAQEEAADEPSQEPTETQPTEEQAGDAPSEADGFDERYGLLVQTNIFLRDRRPPARPEPAARPQPQRTPEQSVRLTGIVFEQGAFRAYFEDMQRPSVTRVSVGDEIARGRIHEILIDAVAYESDEEVTWIEIGQDLTGSTADGSARAGRDDTSEIDPDADPSTLSVAERMRLRRLQESNRE